MSEERLASSSYVRPEITERRIARQWAGLEQAGLPERAPRGRAYRVGFALSGALVLALAWFVVRDFGPSLPSGALIESAEETIAVRLRDGSTIELEPKSSLRVVRDHESAVELQLHEGKARFDVSHLPDRRFTIAAGQAQISVVGTRFEVARLLHAEGSLVQVSVSEGVVEVKRGGEAGDTRRLFAGENWSVFLPREEREGLMTSESAATEEDGVSEEDSVEAGDTTAVPERDRRARRHASAPAKALFARANLARRAGQMQEAASIYSELLRSHPRDARAGLSAFELGRIRMDALSDARGAIGAFSRALRLEPHASFREDALARIVMAQDSLGDRAACRRARARYLRAYPQGVHVSSVNVRCGEAE